MSANNEITIRFHGVRGSLPTPVPVNMRYGGNTPCVEIRSDDQLLILDAGSGIRSLGEQLLRAVPENPITATLLLSHTHWDHIHGIPFFAPAYSPENRIRIFGAYGRSLHLQRALANQMSPLHFPVGLDQMRGLSLVDELSPGATELGNLVVRTTRLNHPGGCTGFRIEGAAGSLAYLPDHEPYRNENERSSATASTHRDLIEFIRDLDLLVLDTQYTTEEYGQRVGWGHGCLSDSVKLAKQGGVRRLLLFHHDPSHNDHQIDQMVEDARELAGESLLRIDAASENESVSLTRSPGSSSNRGLTPDRPSHYPVLEGVGLIKNSRNRHRSCSENKPNEFRPQR